MRRVLMLAGVLAAASCGGAASAPANSTTAGSARLRPHAAQPWELLVRGAPATGVPRAILARHGEAWLRLGGAPDKSPGWAEVDNVERAVVEMRGEHVRLMLDADDVRLFVWVARSDLARVIANEVGMQTASGAEAPAHGRPGVVLAPGTAFTETRRDGDRVAITVEEDALRVEGFVPVNAIGDVWDPAPAHPPEQSHALDAGVVIRASADENAPVLATTTAPIAVRAIAPMYRGWREVVTLGPRVRVQGFVQEREARAEDVDGPGSGGMGYGSSHALSFDVPAGTCLFDDVDGEVIGLVVADRTRLMRETKDPSWYEVIVDSPWGLLDVPVRTAAGSEPPAWERCADLNDPLNDQ